MDKNHCIVRQSQPQPQSQQRQRQRLRKRRRRRIVQLSLLFHPPFSGPEAVLPACCCENRPSAVHHEDKENCQHKTVHLTSPIDADDDHKRQSLKWVEQVEVQSSHMGWDTRYHCRVDVSSYCLEAYTTATRAAIASRWPAWWRVWVRMRCSRSLDRFLVSGSLAELDSLGPDWRRALARSGAILVPPELDSELIVFSGVCVMGESAAETAGSPMPTYPLCQGCFSSSSNYNMNYSELAGRRIWMANLTWPVESVLLLSGSLEHRRQWTDCAIPNQNEPDDGPADDDFTLLCNRKRNSSTTGNRIRFSSQLQCILGPVSYPKTSAPWYRLYGPAPLDCVFSPSLLEQLDEDLVYTLRIQRCDYEMPGSKGSYSLDNLRSLVDAALHMEPVHRDWCSPILACWKPSADTWRVQCLLMDDEIRVPGLCQLHQLAALWQPAAVNEAPSDAELIRLLQQSSPSIRCADKAWNWLHGVPLPPELYGRFGGTCVQTLWDAWLAKHDQTDLQQSEPSDAKTCIHTCRLPLIKKNAFSTPGHDEPIAIQDPDSPVQDVGFSKFRQWLLQWIGELKPDQLNYPFELLDTKPPILEATPARHDPTLLKTPISGRSRRGEELLVQFSQPKTDAENTNGANIDQRAIHISRHQSKVESRSAENLDPVEACSNQPTPSNKKRVSGIALARQKRLRSSK